MLRNFKTIFPWALNIILLIILLWPKGNKSLKDEESAIESRVKIEESLVDSFSSSRDLIILERDSSLKVIDTLEIKGLVNILKENMLWYENKTTAPWAISWDTTGVVTSCRE